MRSAVSGGVERSVYHLTAKKKYLLDQRLTKFEVQPDSQMLIIPLVQHDNESRYAVQPFTYQTD